MSVLIWSIKVYKNWKDWIWCIERNEVLQGYKFWYLQGLGDAWPWEGWLKSCRDKFTEMRKQSFGTVIWIWKLLRMTIEVVLKYMTLSQKLKSWKNWKSDPLAHSCLDKGGMVCSDDKGFKAGECREVAKGWKRSLTSQLAGWYRRGGKEMDAEEIVSPRENLVSVWKTRWIRRDWGC